MLWACSPAYVNSIMLKIEHYVLTLMIMLMVLIVAFLVLQCVLMQWALLHAHVNQVMLGMEYCTDTEKCADAIHNCHNGRTMCANAEGSYLLVKCGYAKHGTLCTDTDECADGTHNCLPGLAMCANDVGSFTCSCK